MRYQTGETIEEGDHVLIENKKTSAVVEKVIDTLDAAAELGLQEIGVLLRSAPFGVVFWPALEIDDPLVFVCKADKGG